MSPNIQPDIFQGLLARHLKPNQIYKAADVKVVELAVPVDGVPKFHSFVVKANEVKGWLTKDIPDNWNEEDPNKTKLRIILRSGFKGEGGEYWYLGHRDVTVGGAESYSSTVPMPLSQDDYRLIAQTFRLPKVAMLLLTRGARPLRGQFHVCQMSSDNDRPIFGFTLNSFSSLLVGIKTSVSLSYDLSTGVINALLFGSELPGELDWLEEDLRHLGPLVSNPFLLPTLVCQHLAESICTSINNNFDELHRVEMSSGQTGIGVVGDDGGVMQRGRCEDPGLPVAILGVAQLAIATEAYVKGHILTVDSVKNELRVFPWHLLSTSERTRSQEQNQLIIKNLDWIMETLKFAQIRVEHLRQRADVQAAAITNLLAQRNNETNRIMVESSTSIAHDTRRDSSAMKSIAILTMVFLPATFTATYFGTPAVVAIRPSQALYWAVTLAVTIVVVLAWLAFFYGWAATRLPATKKAYSFNKA
ncbi:hypothetical protein HD806DRAFT_524716 [Xylariaceae sp. AK1471]|nr:hypothetical protein HD806DRAFT_524716 [Xylariaceae sp. AK1471]